MSETWKKNTNNTNVFNIFCCRCWDSYCVHHRPWCSVPSLLKSGLIKRFPIAGQIVWVVKKWTNCGQIRGHRITSSNHGKTTHAELRGYENCHCFKFKVLNYWFWLRDLLPNLLYVYIIIIPGFHGSYTIVFIVGFFFLFKQEPHRYLLSIYASTYRKTSFFPKKEQIFFFWNSEEEKNGSSTQ